jgi:hypothetical protein
MATSNDNRNFIHRYTQVLGRATLIARTQLRREKVREERLHAEIELWFDDLKAEGIAPRSPLGIAMTAERFAGGEPEPPREEVW